MHFPQLLEDGTSAWVRPPNGSMCSQSFVVNSAARLKSCELNAA